MTKTAYAAKPPKKRRDNGTTETKRTRKDIPRLDNTHSKEWAIKSETHRHIWKYNAIGVDRDTRRIMEICRYKRIATACIIDMIHDTKREIHNAFMHIKRGI